MDERQDLTIERDALAETLEAALALLEEALCVPDMDIEDARHTRGRIEAFLVDLYSRGLPGLRP